MPLDNNSNNGVSGVITGVTGTVSKLDPPKLRPPNTSQHRSAQ